MSISATAVVNPYWHEAKPLVALPSREIEEELGSEAYMLAYIERIERGAMAWGQRDYLVRKYAWAIPDPTSLAFVTEHLGKRAIEIGAGTGYWASLLTQLGVDILAYDVAPPDRIVNQFFDREKLSEAMYFNVAIGDPAVLVEHSDRALFLCWPPYSEDMAYRCLQSYQGKRLVFIGEGEGGCTGDDAFFEELDKHWNEVADHRIAQWYGINDRVYVYDRVEEL